MKQFMANEGSKKKQQNITISVFCTESITNLISLTFFFIGTTHTLLSVIKEHVLHG